MWSSHDNHATTHHPCHLIGWPPSWQPWDLRVPTLFSCDLFLSYCMLMLLWLLHIAHMHACSHSRLGGQLYAPLYPVCIHVPFSSMQTAALVQMPSGLHPDRLLVPVTLWFHPL